MFAFLRTVQNHIRAVVAMVASSRKRGFRSHLFRTFGVTNVSGNFCSNCSKLF